jgi:hypothetical protein
MTAVALVVGAAILLTWMLVDSYWREGSYTRRRSRPAGDGGDGAWMFMGGDGGSSDCGAGDGGGCGGDGGGGD